MHSFCSSSPGECDLSWRCAFALRNSFNDDYALDTEACRYADIVGLKPGDPRIGRLVTGKAASRD